MACEVTLSVAVHPVGNAPPPAKLKTSCPKDNEEIASVSNK